MDIYNVKLNRLLKVDSLGIVKICLHIFLILFQVARLSNAEGIVDVHTAMHV